MSGVNRQQQHILSHAPAGRLIVVVTVVLPELSWRRPRHVLQEAGVARLNLSAVLYMRCSAAISSTATRSGASAGIASS